MGRPPSNGGPAFRFNSNEVAELEAILKDHHNAVPEKEIMVALAEKFSDAPDRKGKFVVQMKQIWNWFQNKRYALRAKSGKTPPGKLTVTPVNRDDSGSARNVLQPAASSLHIPTIAPVPAPVPTPPGTGSASPADNPCMEFEARSVRDGAWYDVQSFLAHRNLESNDPEVQVRFTGFGADEDEWVNVRRHVRPRSLPCEASECVAVLPGDLILCFQEGKDQALYFDAHVLDAQRRRHDVRGCRCRFLVRYDHDQSEEIVPLRKVCRRPETDFRLQQLHAAAKDSASTDQQKTNIEPETSTVTTLRPNSSALQIDSAPMMPRPSSSGVTTVGPPHANIPVATNSSVETGSSNISTNTSASPSSAASTNAPMNNNGLPSPRANV